MFLRHRRMLVWLVGTAGAWAMLDFAYYGNTISSPEVLKVINPNGSLLYNTTLQMLIFVVFALPGYALAIWLLDKTGRKRIQCAGFTLMAAAFLVIGLVSGVSTSVAPFVIIFGVSYLFTEFGPNTTTFIYPAEIFPVSVRTTGHGISAAAGKLGAFAGAYLFPDMLASSMGLRGAETVAGCVCFVGLRSVRVAAARADGPEPGEPRDAGGGAARAASVAGRSLMGARIVVGIDGSEHGTAAFRWALDEARLREGEIIAIFAWQMPMIAVPGAFDRDEIERLSTAFLDDSIDAVADHTSVPIKRLVAQGDVSVSLIEASRDADMLVLGSRGRGGFAGLKLGSVSQACVQWAQCPVVIVKRPGD